MSAPTGLLQWGQAGEYNADNDRAVISALANRHAGIVQAATFTAGSGLTVNLGPWLAIVACADDTLAVIGSRNPIPLNVAAGEVTGSRTDIVWADIDPDGAQWEINLVSLSEIGGRLGVQLGSITVPQQANLASQFTFTPVAENWNPHPTPATVPQLNVPPAGWGVLVGTYDPNKPNRILTYGRRDVTTAADGKFNMPMPTGATCIRSVNIQSISAGSAPTGLHFDLLMAESPTLSAIRVQVVHIQTGAAYVNGWASYNETIVYQ